MGLESSGSPEAIVGQPEASVHVLPTNGRGAWSKAVESLVEENADRVREKLAGADYREAFLDQLLTGMRKGDRTCMNLYPRLVRLVDAERTLVIEIWNRLGVRGADEAQVLVDRAKSAGEQTPREAAETCIRFLEAYLATEPGEREMVARRLGMAVSERERV